MITNIFSGLGKLTTAKYNNKVEKINKLEQTISLLNDEELELKTLEFKARLNKGENLDNLLEEAFAVVREASKRVLGLRHFDVQLIGGIILHKGQIAEMKTGEGKTLVSLLPAYLNALTGDGVHVVTVNDYLARRDSEWVGQVHKFLGLSVGLVQQEMTTEERQRNYSCDVTYTTNSELGFDYLRDNMANQISDVVQQKLNYCIIDEVDSILIDEAKTPLIISGSGKAPTNKYSKTAIIANVLKNTIHYEIDEKTKNVTLNEEGIKCCEDALEITNLYDFEDPWVPYILNALKAKEFYQKDIHYIVRNNEILIVDEFTGRILAGRRWSEGLHQAVEAKEGKTIREESQTLASITYQNFFLLYNKLSGMTGTAKTEEAEFEKIYNMKVVDVPTNLSISRKDSIDVVYRTKYGKWIAVANECLDMYSIGRPVLIGTTSIESSELLASLLVEYNIPYNLLNAKPENIEREAEIIAQAGCLNTITIATNMAGRGTDILIGGNPKYFASNLLRNALRTFIEKATVSVENDNRKEGILTIIEKLITDIEKKEITLTEETLDESLAVACEKGKTSDILTLMLRQSYEQLVNIFNEDCKIERQKILQLGGLHIIGTERHDSRRIDNQLRGRSGRQGEPGTSKFFLSLEDNLLRIFGGERIANVIKNFNSEDDIPLESSLLTNNLDSAQKKVESFSYDARKQLFEYDEVIDSQRKAIYSERKRILEKDNLRDQIIGYGEATILDVLKYSSNNVPNENEKVLELVEESLGLPYPLKVENLDIKELQYQAQLAYDIKEAEIESISENLMREMEKSFLLQQIDTKWRNHLKLMGSLKDSIGWRSYGQLNPVIEYKIEAYEIFIDSTSSIRHNVVYMILRSSAAF